MLASSADGNGATKTLWIITKHYYHNYCKVKNIYECRRKQFVTGFWNSSKSHIFISVYLSLPNEYYCILHNILWHYMEFNVQITEKYKRYSVNTYA